MATMTLTVPDPIVQDVVDAFADQYGYLPLDGNGDPNPETDVQFAKRMIREYVRNVYTAHQAKLFETGRQAVLDSAEADVSGVDVT